MDILEAVHAVLSQHTKPLHFKTLAKEITDKKLVTSANQAIETMINTRIAVDIKKAQAQKQTPRFQKLRNGFISLATPPAPPKPVAQAPRTPGNDRPPRDPGRDHGRGDGRGPAPDVAGAPARPAAERNGRPRAEFVPKYIERLNDVPFPQFEKAIDTLLRRMAPSKLQVVNRRKDGGLDWAANLGFPQNNLSFLVAVRRWTGKRVLAVEHLVEVRGHMERHHFNAGAVVTLGEIGPELAEDIRNNPRMPLFLVGGKDLVDLMLRFEVGIVPGMAGSFQFDEGFWNVPSGDRRGAPSRNTRRGGRR